MGPAPDVAIADGTLKQHRGRGDQAADDIKSLPPTFPGGLEFRQEFPKYNAQVNKYLGNKVGYANFGPFRAPYTDLPEEYQRQLDLLAEARKQLREKYAAVPAS